MRWTVSDNAFRWMVGVGLFAVFVAFFSASEDLALSLEFVGGVAAAAGSGSIAVLCLTSSRATIAQVLLGLVCLALCLAMLGLLVWAVASVV